MSKPLEDLIRDAMLIHGITSLNLFHNGDGVFQANIGRRDFGASRIAKDADPVKAVSLAFKAGMKIKGMVPSVDEIQPEFADQFEDLLG